MNLAVVVVLEVDLLIGWHGQEEPRIATVKVTSRPDVVEARLEARSI